MRKMYPAALGPLADVPASGPAPALMRYHEWAKVRLALQRQGPLTMASSAAEQPCLLVLVVGAATEQACMHVGLTRRAQMWSTDLGVGNVKGLVSWS